MKILYIEDDRHDINLARRELTRSIPDCQLDVVSTLESARRQLEDNPAYDVVLLDLNLPDGSGLDLLAEIRETRHMLTVIVLTGSGSEAVAVAALKAGADDYIIKQADYLSSLPHVVQAAHQRRLIANIRYAHPLRVFYVEHNTADIDLTQRHLTRYAPHIRLEAIFHNVVELLERLPQTADALPYPCDAILIDYKLPGLNALDALKIICHERRLPIPMILITGQGSEEIAVQALRLGAADYLVKHKSYLFELPAILENAHHHTELELEQHSLRKTNEQLRLQSAALDAAANGIVITNKDGTVEWVNAAFTQLTGYTMTEAVGYNPRDLVRSGIHDQLFYKDLWETILSGQVWQGEMVNRRKDGTLYYEEQTITPVTDAQGQITHFVAIKQDISERKIVEKALRQNEERFRALIEHSAEAITLLDKDGVILYESPTAQRILQSAVKNRIGRSIFDLLNDDDLPRIMRVFTDTLRQPRIPIETEFRYWHRDGTFHWAEATVGNLLDEPTVGAIVVNYRDITARKQDQEALLQAQQLAQATIDSLSAHIAVLNEEGVIVAVNQSWLQFVQENDGASSRAGVGVNYLAVCDQATGADRKVARLVAAGIRTVAAGGQSEVTVEYPCDAPHEKRWFVARITPLPAADLEMHWVAVAHENITQRKLAEEAAHLSERRYRLLFDSNPQPMWVYDLDTLAFLAVNDAAVDKYGYTRDEFLAMTLKDIRPPEDIPRLIQDVEQKRPLLQHSGEWRHQLRDGRIIEVEITSHQLNFNDRNAALVVAFDITGRKQAEAERLVQSHRIQQILDTVPEGVVMIDMDSRVTIANPHGKECLQKLGGLEVGQEIKTLDGRSLAEILRRAAQTTYAFQHQDLWFEILAQPIDPDKTQTDWVLLLRDVTEEHEKQQYFQAQERLATVGQLAAGIAHDFNNVMAIIILYTQLARQMSGMPDKSHKYLRTVEDQARHAANMISQILDFSRRSVMEFAPLNLLPLIKEIIKLLRNTLSETIEIETHSEEKEYLLMADPTRLQQAIMNIALNARDAMPQGGSLRFTLRRLPVSPGQTPPLPDIEPGEWLQLQISDTGVGIQPHHLPRLFTPFFTTKEPGKGTGLGLPQVHGIVKQHNGSIDVKSQLGVGSTFTIYLPLIAEDKRVDDSAIHMEENLRGDETILLVEDNAIMRQSMRDALTGLGYQIIEADNGITALNSLADPQLAIDLIISDIIMPEMGGFELRRIAIEQRRVNIKTLLVTGYPLEDNEERLQQLEWMQKPFDIYELARRIRALLDEKT